MKKMNWTKLNNNDLAQSPNSIWAKLQKQKKTRESILTNPAAAAAAAASDDAASALSPNSNTKPKAKGKGKGIDFDQLEGKFCMQDRSTKLAKRISLMPQKRKAFELLDGKRAMQVNVFVKSLPVAANVLLDALETTNGALVTEEQLRGLFNILPDHKESIKFQNWKQHKDAPDNATQLNVADQFFVRLAGLSSYKFRVQLLLLETELEGVVSRLTQEVDALDTVATALVESDALPRLLALILEVGNFFNTGSAGGEACGFALQSLLNITDTKSSSGTDTLLDHLAAHVAAEMPETVEEATELFAILESRKKTADLMMTIAEVHALYRKVLAHKTTSDGLDFTRDYDSFFEYALGTTSALKDIADTLQDKADQLCEMYVEKKVVDIVEPVRQFFGKFVTAVQANEQSLRDAELAEVAAAAAAEAEEVQAKQARKEARQAERRRKFKVQEALEEAEQLKLKQQQQQGDDAASGAAGGEANDADADQNSQLSSSAPSILTSSSSSATATPATTQVTGPRGSKLTQRGSWTVDEDTGMLQNLVDDFALPVPRSSSSPATTSSSSASSSSSSSATSGFTRTRTHNTGTTRRRRAASTSHSIRVGRRVNAQVNTPVAESNEAVDGDDDLLATC